MKCKLLLDFWKLLKNVVLFVVNLITQPSSDHGVNDSTPHIKSRGEKPSKIVGGVVHDLGTWKVKHTSNESLNNPTVKVTSTLMSNWVVTSPSFNSNGVADNVTVISWPSGAKPFHVSVARFQINCNLLSVRQIGKRGGRNPLGGGRK